MKKTTVKFIATLMAMLMFITALPVSVSAADVTAPVLESISADKTLLSAGEIVTFTATVVDESNISLAYISYERPSGVSESIALTKVDDGVYEGELAVADDTESGVWNVMYITLIDKYENTTTVANYPQYTYGEVKQDLSHLSFEVVGTNADIESPVLTSIEMDKSLVSLDETITFTATITDESYIRLAYITYERPSGISDTVTLKKVGEGNTYEGKITVGEQTESGVWNVKYITLYDKYENKTTVANYPQYTYGEVKQDLSHLSFEVIGTNADTDPPVLVSFEMNKTFVSVGETITFTAVVDDENPNSYIYISYERPSGVSESVVLNRISDSNTFQGEFIVDEETVSGVWTVEYISMDDKNDNSTVIANSQTHHYGTTKQDLSYLNFEVKELETGGDATSHIVIFKDGFGATVSTQRVIDGESAIEPKAPTNELYIFNGWDLDFSNVTSDMTITAQWVVNPDVEYDYEVEVGEAFEIEIYSTASQTYTITCSEDIEFVYNLVSSGMTVTDRLCYTKGYEVVMYEPGAYLLSVHGPYSSNILTYKVKVDEESGTDIPTEPSTGGNVVAPDNPPITPPTPSAYDNGDVDLDGRVTIKDATQIQRHLAQLTTLDDIALSVADTDSDGRVTIMDATRIQKFLAQLIPGL